MMDVYTIPDGLWQTVRAAFLKDLLSGDQADYYRGKTARHHRGARHGFQDCNVHLRYQCFAAGYLAGVSRAQKEARDARALALRLEPHADLKLTGAEAATIAQARAEREEVA